MAGEKLPTTVKETKKQPNTKSETKLASLVPETGIETRESIAQVGEIKVIQNGQGDYRVWVQSQDGEIQKLWLVFKNEKNARLMTAAIENIRAIEKSCRALRDLSCDIDHKLTILDGHSLTIQNKPKYQIFNSRTTLLSELRVREMLSGNAMNDSEFDWAIGRISEFVNVALKSEPKSNTEALRIATR